jgi:hypothetical protein
VSLFFKIPDSIFEKMNMSRMPDINNNPQGFHSLTIPAYNDSYDIDSGKEQHFLKEGNGVKEGKKDLIPDLVADKARSFKKSGSLSASCIKSSQFDPGSS